MVTLTFYMKHLLVSLEGVIWFSAHAGDEYLASANGYGKKRHGYGRARVSLVPVRSVHGHGVNHHACAHGYV